MKFTSFYLSMGPPTATDVCDVKSKSVPATKQAGPKLVYTAEQRKVLEVMAIVNCPIAQRDGYDTVW